jgi:hypothetical protein
MSAHWTEWHVSKSYQVNKKHEEEPPVPTSSQVPTITAISGNTITFANVTLTQVVMQEITTKYVCGVCGWAYMFVTSHPKGSMVVTATDEYNLRTQLAVHLSSHANDSSVIYPSFVPILLNVREF